VARIAGIGEAFPNHYYSQSQVADALLRLWRDAGIDSRKIRRLHEHTLVEGRHLVLPIERYGTASAWGEINDIWIREAETLGAAAVSDALERAGLTASDVDVLVFVSVTGLATPSIDARLVNRLGLPVTTRRLPLFGLGCVAGAAGLARCADLSRGDPGARIVLLSVELCSLTLRLDDLSTANIIATGLFGDGAAAVVVTGDGRPADGPSIVATRSILYRGTEHVMGWDISERGFRLVLTPEIPMLVREHLRLDVDRFLGDHGLTRADIGTWMLHTGGPKILTAMQEALQLPEGALDVTWERLRSVGNVSSASVLQVLKQTMERKRPRQGSHGVMAAMGPGFCAELLLVRW